MATNQPAVLWQRFVLHLNTWTEEGWKREEVRSLYLKPEDDIRETKNRFDDIMKLANKRQVCMSCHQPATVLLKRALREANEIWSWSMMSCDARPCHVLCDNDLVGEEYQHVLHEHPDAVPFMEE